MARAIVNWLLSKCRAMNRVWFHLNEKGLETGNSYKTLWINLMPLN